MSNKIPKPNAVISVAVPPLPARGRAARSGTSANRPRKSAARLGLLPGLLGYQLRLAQRAIFDDFADAMGELEVSPGLFGMLVIIEANPGLKQTELAHAAQLDRSSLVPALDKLEARQLVARRASPEDRRVNGLWLTPEGAALLKQLKKRVARHEERLVRGLTAAERATLAALLQRILPERR
jgi:DNA-binding MarR family transcriptional regulator